MALTFPCLRCGAPYEQAKRRASHFCPACRKHRSRERRTAWQREARAMRSEWERMRELYLDAGMNPDHVEQLDDLAADLVGQVVTESQQTGGPSRMPPRALAPAGPDEGVSTGWVDVAAWLDDRARTVERHPWFDAHPHWSFGLNGDEDDRDEVPAAL